MSTSAEVDERTRHGRDRDAAGRPSRRRAVEMAVAPGPEPALRRRPRGASTSLIGRRSRRTSHSAAADRWLSTARDRPRAPPPSTPPRARDSPGRTSRRRCSAAQRTASHALADRAGRQPAREQLGRRHQPVPGLGWQGFPSSEDGFPGHPRDVGGVRERIPTRSLTRVRRNWRRPCYPKRPGSVGEVLALGRVVDATSWMTTSEGVARARRPSAGSSRGRRGEVGAERLDPTPMSARARTTTARRPVGDVVAE